MSLLRLHTSGDGELTAFQSPIPLRIDCWRFLPNILTTSVSLGMHPLSFPAPQKALQMVTAALGLPTHSDPTLRSPVPLVTSQSPAPRSLPCIGCLLVVLWGRGQTGYRKGQMPRRTCPLLGLWSLAIQATSWPGLPHFASLKPHGVPRRSLRPNQPGLFALP